MAIATATRPLSPTRTLARRRLNRRALVGASLAILGVLGVAFASLNAQPQTVTVLTAARDLPAGSVLAASDLVPSTEPLSARMAQLVVPAAEREQIVGHPLGQALGRGDLVARHAVVDTATRIPPDQRVLSIPISPVTAAGGQLTAGDEVEVLVTLDKTRPEQARTETVLPRVTVYAVGHDAASPFAGSESSSGGARTVAWLSLLVDEPQAQALSKARWTGDLDVALLAPSADGQAR